MADIDWTVKGVSNREYKTGRRPVMSLINVSQHLRQRRMIVRTLL
jgi:hypothetical protein